MKAWSATSRSTRTFGQSRLTRKQKMKTPNKYGALLHAPSQTQTSTNNYHAGCGRQDRLSRVHEQQPSFSRPLSSPILAQKTRVAEKRVVKKRHSYEPLETAFTLGSFGYRQIAREKDWAIYEQRWPGSENVCYEVIRIRREEATTFPSGRSYPAREVYPSSEASGTDGFTVTNRDAGFKKLKQMSPAETGKKPIWNSWRQTGTGTNTKQQT